MAPNNEHAFYAWLIVIGAVCVVTLIGALIDRFFLNRRIQRNYSPTSTGVRATATRKNN